MDREPTEGVRSKIAQVLSQSNSRIGVTVYEVDKEGLRTGNVLGTVDERRSSPLGEWKTVDGSYRPADEVKP